MQRFLAGPWLWSWAFNEKRLGRRDWGSKSSRLKTERVLRQRINCLGHGDNADDEKNCNNLGFRTPYVLEPLALRA